MGEPVGSLTVIAPIRALEAIQSKGDRGVTVDENLHFLVLNGLGLQCSRREQLDVGIPSVDRAVGPGESKVGRVKSGAKEAIHAAMGSRATGRAGCLVMVGSQ